MDPVTAMALAAGAGQLAGGVWSNVTNLGEGKRARAFARDMSSSAYQRAVADMKMAGLNPMLAFMQGGASTPGAPTGSVTDAIGPAVSSAQHARRLSSELATMKATEANIREDTELKFQQSLESIARKAQAYSARDLQDAERNAVNTSRRLNELSIPQAEQSARAASGGVGRAGAVIRQLFGPGGLSPFVGGAAGAAIGRFRR